ncbi:probable cytochrome P450 301a1, mitochondrial [Thrips palmi]|uniref:Probable cytochrome P450 301a1, mitochondrial n=1 Tax=Thrips palmi TaxID=161013 RepID=A0A6P8Y9P3_THRPL|nr:probable cytochrome P450 301a1, mitochondrial [Thrips palmi]
MFRISQSVRTVVGAQKANVSLRLRSTQSATALADASGAASDLEWENAQPYTKIPGPEPLPVIGNIYRFLPMGEFYKLDTTELFKSLHKTYGPVVKLAGFLGKPDVVTVFDADEVARVFRNEGPWPFRRGADSLDYYYRNLRTDYPPSLVVVQGKEWQEFRTAVNQVMMQPRNTKQYVEPIDRVSQEFVDRMKAVRNDKLEMPPDFFHEIAKWALESITFVALDAELGLLKNLEPNSEASKMIQAVHVVFDSMYQLDFKPSPWKFVSTPAYRRFVTAMNFVTGVSAKYVNLAMERLKQLPPNEERNFSVLENLLIRTEDPQRAVTMALDMLLAGIDTTGTVVATVMYQLATNPDKQQKLHEELDRVIPDPSKPLTKQQLEDMRYLRACIKESMRVMPILVGNARTTIRDLVIGGYQVPKGTLVSMSTREMTSNEAYFPRALEFLPERWLPGADDIKGTHPFAFLPFGFGPRMCVGRRFADLEIETVVAKVFRNFSMEWNRPPAKATFRILFSFTDPLAFTVKDRV